MAVLKAAGLTEYKTRNQGTVLLFRQSGKPVVDFYPGTGRWRSGNKTYEGGASAFMAWYNRIEASGEVRRVYGVYATTKKATDIINELNAQMNKILTSALELTERLSELSQLIKYFERQDQHGH